MIQRLYVWNYSHVGMLVSLLLAYLSSLGLANVVNDVKNCVVSPFVAEKGHYCDRRRCEIIAQASGVYLLSMFLSSFLLFYSMARVHFAFYIPLSKRFTIHITSLNGIKPGDRLSYLQQQQKAPWEIDRYTHTEKERVREYSTFNCNTESPLKITMTSKPLKLTCADKHSGTKISSFILPKMLCLLSMFPRYPTPPTMFAA